MLILAYSAKNDTTLLIYAEYWEEEKHLFNFVKLQGLGLKLGVDFTFAWDNPKNENDKNDNPHLNFVKGTVLGDKEQGVGIKDKG